MTAGENEYLWHSNYNLEVSILYSIAALGICLNIFQTVCILIEREFRNILSAFLIHGALINGVLASYCIVFALSLHDKSFQNICKYLGSSFIVIMTANIVNLIAIIASEIYKLNNLENTINEQSSSFDDKGNSSNVYCILFGLVIVYAASLILHLGPTVIAGNFSYDETTGFCLFVFGQRKNYVVFVVWIVIVTLVLLACSYYLYSFHICVNRINQSQFDSAIDDNLGSLADVNFKFKMELIFTKSRAWTLSCVTGLHVLCWYPLFGLLISDRDFNIPIGLYRAFTCLAWSNAFLEPLIYLLLDRKTSRCCLKFFTKNNPIKYRKQFIVPTNSSSDNFKSSTNNNNDNNINININKNNSTTSNNKNSSRMQFIGDRLKSPSPLIENDNQIELNEFPQLCSTEGLPVKVYSGKKFVNTNEADNVRRNINYIEC